MTTKENAKNDYSATISTEPHEQACTCWRGLKRSLMACQTCRNWDHVLTRMGGDYVAN
jgi:hypothetical protein